MSEDMHTDSQKRTHLFGLLKYHPIELLKSFQNGLIYCNSIQEFAKLDPIDGRGDKFETATSVKFEKVMRMDLKYHDTHYEFMKLGGDKVMITSRNNDFFANLFCLYSLQNSKEKQEYTFSLSPKMKEMGNYALFIYHPIEFLRRLTTKLKNDNFLYKCGFVEYINLIDINGRKSYFQKPKYLEYQNEFRIMIKNEKDSPLKIEIGSIADISVILPIDQIEKMNFRKNNVR